MAKDLYLVPAEPYRKGSPSATQDLITMYGLTDLAASVARTDPMTGAKRKLRKSYKNHVADLAGKHPIPDLGDTPWTLGDLARRPVQLNADIAPLAPDLLSQLKLERSPTTGIPGFDVKLLATYGQTQEPYTQVLASSPKPDKQKKRKDAGIASAEKRRKMG